MAPIYYFGGGINTRSWAYQQRCMTQPIPSTAVAAIIFSGFDVLQGVPPAAAFAPRSIGSYFLFLYTYHILQCPMEAIHGRPSLWHNIVAGGSLGAVGVASGRLGIPFVSPLVVYQSGLPPAALAFGVYGGMAGIFAGVLGTKSF